MSCPTLVLILLFAVSMIWTISWLVNPKPNILRSRIRVPEMIDLGECEAGQVAMSEFDIVNDGNSVLNIAGVRASCSCTGLETRQPDGQFAKLSEVTLFPSERKTVLIRLAVNGPPGESITSTVQFQTNDPDRPEITIGLKLRRITAGAFSQPLAFAFGTVSVHQKLMNVVDVIDGVVPPRAVDRIGLSKPNSVKVARLPIPESEVQTVGGSRIARLQIEVPSETPAEIDERVFVWLVNEAPMSPVAIRVLGRIAAEVEFNPKSIVLLPTSKDEFKGIFLCLTHGHVVQFRVLECPPAFHASFADSVAPTAPRQLVVTRTTKGPPATVKIRVGATIDGLETVHDLKVKYDPNLAAPGSHYE